MMLCMPRLYNRAFFFFRPVFFPPIFSPISVHV